MGTPLVFQANEALTLRTRLGRASCSQDRSASRDALRPAPIWSRIWAPARAGCPDRRFAARKKSSAYREVSGQRADIRNPTRLPSRPGEFHPEPLADPDLILSHHPARATDRRLPPSVELRAHPVAGWPVSTSMTHPLRSTTITAASSLLRGSPPLSGASVLSALRLEPLAPFPLASPARFSRSLQEPG